jgi:predicted anti-sigma-YlaC factor YlaD
MNLPPSRRAAQSDDHARARTLAAMRVDTPLARERAAWLDAHLSTCDSCRAAADGFEADRSLLRGLAAPVPPRDLWAATAARLDREGRQPRSRSQSFRVGRVPMGALAGVLVVAVVVGASYLTDRGSVPAASPEASSAAAAASAPSSTLTAAATPIAIDRQVGLVHAGTNGALGVLTATVDEVCAAASSSQCQADTNGSTSVAVSQHPRSVVQSPNGKQLAFVLATGQGGSVVIVPAPSAGSSPPPSVNPTASPSSTATPSPSASASASASAASASPSVRPSTSPSPSPTPSAPRPSASPTPPIVLPSPSLAAAPIAIADDVTVIGQSAAYSPSGNWFAFSARPADGSRGPDIYVWRVGDAKARPVTTDHRSVFSTWIGDNVLGSRAEPLAAAAGTQNDDAATLSAATGAKAVAAGPTAPGVEARSVSFLLDPLTGASRIVPGDGIWRPVVDPSGRFAVYWSGTIEVDSNGVDWSPANGTLVLARWDPSQLVAPVTPTPRPSASPSASPTASASPSPGAPVALLASRPVADWDARWDETGTYLGLWLADRAGSTSGRLTLHTVDLASGTLDAAGALFNDQPARTGFAIGQGRLAWVMPGGSGGPVVKVYAWSGAKGGTAQTPAQPDDTLVIR